MNRRCFAHENDQWIRIVVDDGPFHRQYRHQQHPERELRKRDNREESELESPFQAKAVGQPSSQYHQFLPFRSTNQAYRLHPQSNGHSVNQIAKRHQDDPTRSGNGIPHYPSTEEPSNGSPHGHDSPPKELLWFRTNTDQRPKVVTLLDRFDSAGLNVKLCSNHFEGSDRPTGSLHCALIMLECVDTREEEMLLQLECVRAQSKAPLVILTDNTTLDWSLLALRGGADAIFTLNTPDDIILARSNALLRRWSAG